MFNHVLMVKLYICCSCRNKQWNVLWHDLSEIWGFSQKKSCERTTGYLSESIGFFKETFTEAGRFDYGWIFVKLLWVLLQNYMRGYFRVRVNFAKIRRCFKKIGWTRLLWPSVRLIGRSSSAGDVALSAACRSSQVASLEMPSSLPPTKAWNYFYVYTLGKRVYFSVYFREASFFLFSPSLRIV